MSSLFISMIVLVQTPYLALGMEDEELVKTAFYNTFMRTSYGIKGNIELTDSKSLPFKLQLEGAVNEKGKYLQLRTDLLQEKAFLGFYQQEQQVILTTPIKCYEKLIFERGNEENSQHTNSDMINKLGNLITQVDVEKNKLLLIGDEVTGYYVQTDQYIINVSSELLMTLINHQEFQALIASQLREEVPIQITLSIDSELQIRRIEGIVPLKSNTILVTLEMDDFDKKVDIINPDPSDALQIKGSISQIIKQFMEKQVPLN